MRGHVRDLWRPRQAELGRRVAGGAVREVPSRRPGARGCVRQASEVVVRRLLNDPTKAALLAQKSRWRLRSRKNYLQGYVLRGIGRFADDGLLREWSAQVNFHPVLDDWRPYCTRDHGVGAVGRGVGRVAGAPSARGARIWLLANMLAYPECDRLCVRCRNLFKDHRSTVS